jgi:DNA-binding NarL/FixJ family response regulator
MSEQAPAIAGIAALAVDRHDPPGLSNAQIGRRLFMSEATVKAHVSRVLAKLGMGNRVQAAMLVHDAGLMEP